jgi:hypothetical protein
MLEHLRNFSFIEYYQSIVDSKQISSLVAAFLDLDVCWHYFLLCVSGSLLSQLVIRILTAAPTSPSKLELSNRLPSICIATPQHVEDISPCTETQDRCAAEVYSAESNRHRLRALEMECDALRAEAQRCGRLEAELAVANIRIEELTQIIHSSNFPRTFCSPPAASAAAATPTCTADTPLRIAHRTPSSAATKSLTVRASLLQKTHKVHSTPIAHPHFSGT